MTSRSGKMVSLVFFAVLVLLFQNCDGGCARGGQFLFSGSHEKSDVGGTTGDGEPYEGKPEPGVYYRMLPAYQCAGNSRVYASIEVSTDKMVERSVNPADCSESDRQVAADQVEASPYNKDFLGFGDGIYMKMLSAPDPANLNTAFVESWCRLIDPQSRAIDVVVKENPVTQEATAGLTGIQFVSKGPVTALPEQSSPVAKTLSKLKLDYRSTDMHLEIDLTRKLTNGLHPGRLVAGFAGQALDADVLCRTGSWLDSNSTVPYDLAWDFSSGILPPALTVARATSATYYDASGNLRTAAANAPRFDHDPVTLAPRGLLVEGAATNILPHSNDFQAVAWDLRGFTIEQNTAQTTAPDGTNSATYFKISNVNEAHHIEMRLTNLSAATRYTLSVYAKAANNQSQDLLRLQLIDHPSWTNEVWANFHLADGSVDRAVAKGDGSGVVATAEPVGNGWYRLRVSGIPSATATSIAAVINPVPTSSATSAYQGDGLKGYYLWGAQLEMSAAPSSYIATDTSPATRAADLIATSDLGWYRADEGTLLAAASRPAYEPLSAPARPTLFSMLGSASGEYSVMFDPTAGLFSARIDAGSGSPTEWSSPVAPTPGALFKLAFGYRAGDSSLIVNGNSTASAANVATGLSASQFVVGGSGAAGSHWNGTILSLRYWPALLDAQTRVDLTR